MKSKIYFLVNIILFSCMLTVMVFAQNESLANDTSKLARYVKGTVLVILKEGVTKESLDSINQAIEAKSIERTIIGYKDNEMSDIEKIYGGTLWTITFPTENDVYEVIENYKKNGSVIDAFPNAIYYATATPNDTYFANYQNCLQNSATNLASIQAEAAWEISQGSSSIKVAVLDSGVDTDHSDLDGHLSTGYDYVVRDNIIHTDSDGNRWIARDDWNTPDANPEDVYGHGTHVAGIIGAETNNSQGIAGVAWDVEIVPVKVLCYFEQIDENDNGMGVYKCSGTFDDIINGITYASDESCNVINMSFTSWSDYPPYYENALLSAYYNDIVLVAAAGNDNSTDPYYPACFNCTISVGNVWLTGQKYLSSNYGTDLDLSAPGYNIYSTIINDSYGSMTGTSMAAPHVSGVAALLLSLNSNLGPAEVKDILCKSANKPSIYTYTAEGKNDSIGYGTLDAHQALFRAKKYGQIYRQMTIYHDIEFDGDVVIPAYKTLTIKEGVTVSFSDTQTGSNEGVYSDECEIIVEANGKLVIEDGVTFTRQGASGDWGTILVESGGKLEVQGGMTIEYATTGLNIQSTEIYEFPTATSTIRNCNTYGLILDNCLPNNIIKNIFFDNNGSGGILVMGTSSGTNVEYVTIEDSDRGIYMSFSSQLSLKYSNIEDNITYHRIQMSGTGNVLSMASGQNNITYGGGYYAVYNNNTSMTVSNNYWGASPPVKSDVFSHPDVVTWSPSGSYFTGSGAPKRVLLAETDPLDEATGYEFAGNLGYAIDCYKEIVETHTDENYRICAIKSLMRAMKKNRDNISEIRSIISNEIESDTYERCDILEFLLNELLLKEGLKEEDESLSQSKYYEAIAAFKASAEKYKGTEMEVEMLARIANIYGDFLDDRDTAKVYADKSAAINPGQPILLSAYASAAITYDPWQYENIFDDSQAINRKQVDDDAVTEENEAFVKLSPNPANPATTIHYSITDPSMVKINIYSISGQKVATLVDSFMSAGQHSAVFDGSKLGSGIYFYRFESAGFNKTGKIMLVK